MGVNASFFDQLEGKVFDKIYINKTKSGIEIFLTFKSEDTIRIEADNDVRVCYKQNTISPIIVLKHEDR